MALKEGQRMLLRSAVGSELRALRIAQSRTLRDVAREARVSLGYLSEVERGQKEASSELLAAICSALNVQLGTLLGEVTALIAKSEKASLAVVKPIDEKISDAA